jgi:hypothetical protein
VMFHMFMEVFGRHFELFRHGSPFDNDRMTGFKLVGTIPIVKRRRAKKEGVDFPPPL